MISKERIEQAAKEYELKAQHGHYDGNNPSLHFEVGVRFAEAELKPKIGADTIQNLFNYFQQEHGIMLMPSDLHEIENYMQPEVSTVAQEFAEWCANNNYQWNKTYKYWYNDRLPLKTELVFAKFDAERSVK